MKKTELVREWCNTHDIVAELKKFKSFKEIAIHYGLTRDHITTYVRQHTGNPVDYYYKKSGIKYRSNSNRKSPTYNKIKNWVLSHDIEKELINYKTFRNISKKNGFDENYFRVVLEKETGKSASQWYLLSKKMVYISDDKIPTTVPFSCVAEKIKKDCVSYSSRKIFEQQTKRKRKKKLVMQKETAPRVGCYCNNKNIIINNTILYGCENCKYYEREK